MSNLQDESFNSPPEVEDEMQEEFEEEAMADPEGESGFDETSDIGDSEAEDLEDGFSEDLLQIKQDVAAQLAQLIIETEAAEAVDAEAAIEGVNNIVGVGLGAAEDDFSDGLEPGTPALNVYVAEAISVDEVKSPRL